MSNVPLFCFFWFELWVHHLLASVKKFPPAYGVAYGEPWDRLEPKTMSQGLQALPKPLER